MRLERIASGHKPQYLFNSVVYRYRNRRFIVVYDVQGCTVTVSYGDNPEDGFSSRSYPALRRWRDLWRVIRNAMAHIDGVSGS